MKKLAVLLIAIGGLLSGCVAYVPNRVGRAYSGDRDRDGVPDRVDRDRDGDGVPNRQDTPGRPSPLLTQTVSIERRRAARLRRGARDLRHHGRRKAARARSANEFAQLSRTSAHSRRRRATAYE
jgi:hypothetical protein